MSFKKLKFESLNFDKLQIDFLNLFFLSLILALVLINQKLAIILGLILAIAPFAIRIRKFDVFLFLLILSLILEKYSYYIGFAIRLPMLFIFVSLLGIFLHKMLNPEYQIKDSIYYRFFGMLFSIYMLGALWATNSDKVLRVSVFYLILFALFFIVYQVLNNERRIFKAFKYIIYVGLLGGLYGIYQIIAYIFNLPHELPFLNLLKFNERYYTGLTVFTLGDQVVPRINSTFNDPVLIGSFCGMSLMFAVCYLLYNNFQKTQETRTNLKYATACLILFVSAILTFSRSTWIGLFLGFIVLIYFLLKNRNTNRFAYRIFFYLISLTGLIFLIYPDILFNLYGRLIQSFDLSDISTSSHLKWMMVAIHAWSEYPILGVGLNNFGEFYAANYQGHSATMAHSAYFSFIAQTGIVGFIVEMLLIFYVVLSLIKSLKLAKMVQNWQWFFTLLGILSGFVVLLGANITYYFYTQFYVWFTIALAASAVDVFKKKFQSQNENCS